MEKNDCTSSCVKFINSTFLLHPLKDVLISKYCNSTNRLESRCFCCTKESQQPLKATIAQVTGAIDTRDIGVKQCEHKLSGEYGQRHIKSRQQNVPESFRCFAQFLCPPVHSDVKRKLNTNDVPRFARYFMYDCPFQSKIKEIRTLCAASVEGKQNQNIRIIPKTAVIRDRSHCLLEWTFKFNILSCPFKPL